MRFADNITITFTVTNKIILRAWEQACKDVIGPEYEPMATSGLEGSHSVESGHYHGRSLDFRLSDIPYLHHVALREKAQAILGEQYLVLLEDQPVHVHIQRSKNTF